MAVDLEQILPAIVVEIDEVDAPADEPGIGREAGSHADVLEEDPVVVVEEIRVIVGEVGLDDVEPAIAVEVADADTHAALLEAMLVERDAHLGRVVREGAVAVVQEQDARCGVARDVDIRPAVLVEIRRHRRERVVFPHLPHARRLADVLKRAIAQVAVERDAAEWQSARAAVDGHALPFAVGGLAGRRGGLRIELLVLRDDKVEQPIPVVVHEAAAGTPLVRGTADACRAGDVGEAAVAIVAVERVRAPIGDEKIQLAVVVVVARADGAAPAGPAKPAGVRHVLECAVPDIPVQAARRCLVLGEALQRGSVDEKGVQLGVAVVIQERHARAIGLDDVVLFVASAVREFQVEARFRGNIDEDSVPREPGRFAGLDGLGVGTRYALGREGARKQGGEAERQ